MQRLCISTRSRRSLLAIAAAVGLGCGDDDSGGTGSDGDSVSASATVTATDSAGTDGTGGGSQGPDTRADDTASGTGPDDSNDATDGSGETSGTGGPGEDEFPGHHLEESVSKVDFQPGSYGSGDCVSVAAQRPTAELPDEHTNAYVIDLVRWQISNDGTNPVQTRQGINAAIAWATEQGHDLISLPPGEYLVGEDTNPIYTAGIELRSDMTLDLSDDVVIRLVPNDRPNYCIIDLASHSNVTIRGGEIIGERDEHDYVGDSAHSEGHAICAWTAVDRVLIEYIDMHDVTGDGVLVLGEAASNPKARQATNVTIRNNRIHHNRRQGVSIVGGANIVVDNNHIHHINGSEPQFGIDIEGAGRRDNDIWIVHNNFHDNRGGDFVSSTGRNVWFEENTLTQCQTDARGEYDPDLPCDLKWQTDGPFIHWTETDNVIINNVFRNNDVGTANSPWWGIVGYGNTDDRQNPVGNFIMGNTFVDAGLNMAYNSLFYVTSNTFENGILLGEGVSCLRADDNAITRGERGTYYFDTVSGLVSNNTHDGTVIEFDMTDEAPITSFQPFPW